MSCARSGRLVFILVMLELRVYIIIIDTDDIDQAVAIQ